MKFIAGNDRGQTAVGYLDELQEQKLMGIHLQISFNIAPHSTQLNIFNKIKAAERFLGGLPLAAALCLL